MKKNKLYLAILWGLAGGLAGETIAATDLFNNPVSTIGASKPVDTFNSPVGSIGSQSAPTPAITTPLAETKPLAPATATATVPVAQTAPAAPASQPETTAAATPVPAAPAANVAPATAATPATDNKTVAAADAQQPAKSKLWSYQPVKEPVQPDVKNKGWVRTPVDAFVLAALEAKGLNPSGDADRAAFIRRATLDVWGVIPTPDDVATFVNDTSPDAYEKLADRLLSSTKYGERQARRWLDLARYADSTGFQNDGTRPNFWRYRDYVINAFNSDKPYSQFIQEQIAGDEILHDKK